MLKWEGLHTKIKAEGAIQDNLWRITSQSTMWGEMKWPRGATTSTRDPECEVDSGAEYTPCGALHHQTLSLVATVTLLKGEPEEKVSCWRLRCHWTAAFVRLQACEWTTRDPQTTDRTRPLCDRQPRATVLLAVLSRIYWIPHGQ